MTASTPASPPASAPASPSISTGFPDTMPLPDSTAEAGAVPPPRPPAPATPPMAPLPAAERIQALDVVRGFALLGIFLMNIEWFNRPFTTFGEGMPRGLTGLDWLASWFIAYFVQGKFWTIFSLVFGMGFAVMLTRAEAAGRDFKRLYLRRVLALAVFGAAHFIFLWDGDILFTYAVSALLLMVVLYGRPKPLLAAIALAIGLGVGLDAEGLFAVAGGLAVAGLLALFLRNERLLHLRRLRVPVVALLLLVFGVVVSVAAVVFWVVPDLPTEPRMPTSVFGPLLLLLGALAWRHHQPAAERPLRLGVTLYVLVGTVMTLMGLSQRFGPDPLALPAASAAASSAALSASSSATSASSAAPVAAASRLAAAPASAASGAKQKPRKTPEERVAERKAERAKRLAEYQEEKAKEIRVMSAGTYGDTVDYRARRFLQKAAGDFGGAVLFIGMFLIGAWFVRAGVMERSREHLPLFRRLALVGLPLGIGLGLAGSLIAMHHTPGDRLDGFGIAQGLTMLGNLPACVGYVSLVVLMLHATPAFAALARIRVLAPMGRMALTNYLTQSLLCALYFHHYGLGQWGLPRAWQVVFVLVVYTAQVAFSHWWLARFRYGPMEWLWRGFTYRETPKLRL